MRLTSWVVILAGASSIAACARGQASVDVGEPSSGTKDAGPGDAAARDATSLFDASRTTSDDGAFGDDGATNPLDGSGSGDDDGAITDDAATANDAGADGANTTEGDAGADAAGTSTSDAGIDSGGTCVAPNGHGTCGIAPQCGCAADQTCDITGNGGLGGTSCVPSGSAPLGGACGTTSDCTSGLTCFSGVCHQYCSQANDCATGDACYQPSGLPSDFFICSIACAPQNPAAACTTATCIYLETSSTSGFTDCAAGGTTAPNQSCSSSTDCEPGFICAGTEFSGLICENWCRVGHSDCASSPTGSTCSALEPTVTVGGSTYGACD